MRGQLTKTETKLSKANQKADRWKKETAAQRTAASRSDARVEKLRKKLDRAAAALEPVQAVGPLEAAASGLPVGEPTTADGLTVPDETWTVVQLRAEARARGLVECRRSRRPNCSTPCLEAGPRCPLRVGAAHSSMLTLHRGLPADCAVPSITDLRRLWVAWSRA